jgi:transcriptional regulator with XRE-family HTH domain
MTEQDMEYIRISARMGARLRAARERKHWSQLQLAEMIQASQTQIEHYERGEHDIAMARLFDLAKLLDLELADLFADL